MRQYIFGSTGFRENCTLNVGFQGIILHACHRKIGFYNHLTKHLCIRNELYDTDIGRRYRLTYSLISYRGYFHYLIFRCCLQCKRSVFTADGSSDKCRIWQ